MSPRVASVLLLLFVSGALVGISVGPHLFPPIPPPPPPPPSPAPVEICPSQSPLYLSAIEALFDARDPEPVDVETMRLLHNTTQSVNGRQFLRTALAPARKSNLVALVSTVAAAPCVKLYHAYAAVECAGQRVHVLSMGPRAVVPAPDCSAPCTGTSPVCDSAARLARSVRASTVRCADPPSHILPDTASVTAGQAQGRVECVLAEPGGTLHVLRSD
jgi:hypothetical protein